MAIKLDDLLNPTTVEVITEQIQVPIQQEYTLPDIDTILREWSWRCDKGYPDFNNISDRIKLQEVLDELNIQLPFDRIQLISEANFAPANLNKEKYFQGFIEKITNSEPFILEKDKSKVYIDKSFLKVLNNLKRIKNLSDRQNEMRNLFGLNAVIPTTNNKFIKLSDISKDTFTAKTTEAGLVGTETPDFKEGLVVFLYKCSNRVLDEIVDRVVDNTPIKSNIQADINAIDPKLYGQKSADYVTGGMELLKTDTVLDPKTKKLYLNAVSAARTIQSKFGVGFVIDRGELFESIRTVANGITKIPKDKWCPGDVYLYKSSSIDDIVKTLDTSKKNGSIVNIEDKNGKVLQVGLNSLFESENPTVIAISLKEEDALSGRAKEFLAVKNISGEQLGTQTSDFTKLELQVLKGELPISKKIVAEYDTEYESEKKKYNLSVRKFGYTNTFGSSKVHREPDAIIITRNRIVKSAVYRMLTTYFSDFSTLKTINPIMSKYKDPFLALTAFGVSLSGFNPTFFKVVALSKGAIGHVTEFKGRDSLKLESDSVATIDTPTKAGVYLEFFTKMGTKKYRTKLDIREAKGGSSISIAIIVDEFKEA
jgi:hypothetical protein